MNITPLFLDSISTGEIVLVVLFILIFFGAESLPKIARTLGRSVRQIKDMSSDVQREITGSVKKANSEFQQINKTINSKTKAFEKQIEQVISDKKDDD